MKVNNFQCCLLLLFAFLPLLLIPIQARILLPSVSATTSGDNKYYLSMIIRQAYERTKLSPPSAPSASKSSSHSTFTNPCDQVSADAPNFQISGGSSRRGHEYLSSCIDARRPRPSPPPPPKGATPTKPGIFKITTAPPPSPIGSSEII